MDKASINQQLELYLTYKRYKQPICDVFPIIAANALKTELCIINETGNNSCDLITLPPKSPSEQPTLYLHRINDNHYNGLQSVSAQNRHQTTPSAVPLAIPQVDNHALLHSASQVNCRTKSSVAHTPWQISSEGGQSRAMQAPACIRYSAAELRSLRHSHKLNRSIRKLLFKYNIWQPRSRSRDISTAEFTSMEATANITIGLLNARPVCNKALLIRDLIIARSLDVLALTEIWNPSNCPIAELLPPGYEIVHKRRQDKRGV